MAELVAVRHKTQSQDDDPGLMAKDYFDLEGKDKGYVLVSDEAAEAAAVAASGEPAAEPAPKKGR